MQVKLEGTVMESQDIMGWEKAQELLTRFSQYGEKTNAIAAQQSQFHVYAVKLKNGKYAYVIEHK